MAVQKMFKKIGDPKALEVKLAPQEQIIFDAIPKSKGGIERADLLVILEGKVEELKTRQKVASILGYYTKHLIDSKLIEIEKVVTEPVKAEKPAKADKKEAKAA